ncbi:hypothetical protein [Candidatus Enterococcus clewellii]|uniref:hypothetical protein n=1 Tax=Candidatus Enterococcus clewellii TaxID=1834193 RepID=UPI000A3492AF
MYFPYFLDVDIPKEASVKKYKEMIARLFCCLREEGWQVVIACGFEEELPGNGRSLYNKE